MQLYGQRDTIVAIATPPGHGGIGVVRISGADAHEVLSTLWSGKPSVEEFESHRLYYGPIRVCGAIVDRVLISWMKQPRSYTGEDVVEISGHGGPAVLKRVLEACCAAGARVAEPGEFTRRAYLNGKMDLAQAEAVADVIAASSEEGLRLAQYQLAGRLSSAIGLLNDRLTKIRAFVEASIDFPEEDITDVKRASLCAKLEDVAEEAARLSESFVRGQLLREGVRVVIAGLPNAGKSSLFNALVGVERAIVHHLPGTTRDMVEASAGIAGMTFHFCDTAGLRECFGEVERMGVSRASEEMSRADVVIYVIDESVGMTVEDDGVLEGIAEGKRVVVLNKIDLVGVASKERPASKASKEVFVSAKTGEGIDALKNELVENVRRRGTTEPEGVVVTNVRHRNALDHAIETIRNATAALKGGDPVECIAHTMRQAQDWLGRIIGDTTDDDVLNEIFSRFCIGK